MEARGEENVNTCGWRPGGGTHHYSSGNACDPHQLRPLQHQPGQSRGERQPPRPARTQGRRPPAHIGLSLLPHHHALRPPRFRLRLLPVLLETWS